MKIIFISLCVALIISCTSVTIRTTPQNHPEDGTEAHPPSPPGQMQKLDIPPGHLPPPGKCRIWIPGKPAGHQSPPGNCHELASKVPPGAWLITREGTGKGDNDIKVSFYHPRKRGVVVEIKIFDYDTGNFKKELKP